MKLSKEEIILVGVTLTVLVALASFLPSLTVLSVDRIWLYERGVEGSDGELKGGVWRVTATSGDAKVQFLSLNQSSMKAEAQSPDDFPSDVLVNGEIYVSVSQPYNPYWVVPVKDLGVIEVTPEVQGVYLNNEPLANPKEARGGKTAESLKVHLWGLDLSQKKVVVPFEVLAEKTEGEFTGTLVTDDPRAVEVSTPEGHKAYRFDISQSDLTDGETGVINFYNPSDPEEKLKLNLLWSFGDYDKYGWNYDLLFVTPDVDNFTPETEVTFMASDENSIRRQLDWRSGDDWTFCNYWYGGGSVFKGTAAYRTGSGVTTFSGAFIRENGVSTGKIATFIRTLDGRYITSLLVAEGFLDGSTTQIDIFEYPGWYTPHKNAVESGGTEPEDWMYWRYPLSPNVFASTSSTPVGLGVVSYLASSVSSPVTNLVHQPFQRVNPDIWGEGIGGYVGVNGQIGVVMPSAAREWLFTLDVSTELVDTVVVRQDYIDVQIVSPLTFSQTTLAAGESASGTVKLRNTSPYSGVVSVGIEAPDSLKYTSKIAGGDGSMSFAANEEKTVVFTITNTGLLDEEKSGVFTLKIVNQNGRVTDSQTFSMAFKPGLGVPDTVLDVTTVDADTGVKVGGVSLRVEYGTAGEYSKSASTVQGEATFELGKYSGEVKLSAVDYEGRYKPTEKTFYVDSGLNSVVIHMIPVSAAAESGLDWGLLALAGTVLATAFMLVYVLRRRKR